MKNGRDLKSYLARLVQEFDQGIHASTEDVTLKGWGKFLSPESHQIGLYGTCSGILVTTIGTPSAPIDSGIVKYVVSLWRQRRSQTQRYFNQTIRLAYFVLSLTRVQVPELLTIRNEAIDELAARQRPDGGWGDWSGAPSRIETTAWAVLALARLSELSTTMTARKGAVFLQQRVLGFKDFADWIDPFILAVILHASPPELSGRICSAALRRLSSVRPSDELQVYFVDFMVESEEASEMHRDYICVPRFFGFCLLASAPIRLRSPFFADILVAISHRRAIAHLDKILAAGLLRTSASRFPSTVDQAFVALSVEYTVASVPQFSDAIRWGHPIYIFIRGNLVFRIIIPLLLLTFITTISHDPKNLVDLIPLPERIESTGLR